MRKFAVFSGFLGAGKTTAMMALTKTYAARYGQAVKTVSDRYQLELTIFKKDRFGLGE